MSLYAIAQKMGIIRASLARFVRGDSSLRLDMADKLASFFELDLTKRKGRWRHGDNHPAAGDEGHSRGCRCR